MTRTTSLQGMSSDLHTGRSCSRFNSTRLQKGFIALLLLTLVYMIHVVSVVHSPGYRARVLKVRESAKVFLSNTDVNEQDNVTNQNEVHKTTPSGLLRFLSKNESRLIVTQIKTERLAWIPHLNASDNYREYTETTQTQTMKRIMQMCYFVPRLDTGMLGRTRFVALRNSHILYGVMPKTGTSNLLRKFCIMIGSDCTSQIGSENEHYFMIYNERFFQTLTMIQLQPHRLNSAYLNDKSIISDNTERSRSFMFTVVRNPWERLLSTYIDKFLYSTEYLIICLVARDFPEFKRLDIHWTFKDMIERCVLHQYYQRGMAGMNEHLRPQFISGAFCDIRYNYIARLETFDVDEIAILKQFNSSVDIEQLGKDAYRFRKMNEKTHFTKDAYEIYWRSIDETMIKSLQELFSLDLKMFDYPDHPLL